MNNPGYSTTHPPLPLTGYLIKRNTNDCIQFSSVFYATAQVLFITPGTT